MCPTRTEQPYRVLWGQVVLQAKDDLEREPIGSLLYNQAAAFFLNRGEWAESRAAVADCLHMHPDDLSRSGKRWIAERRSREGLPPEPTVPPNRSTQTPLPTLVATMAPQQEVRKRRHERPHRADNPFSQFRRKANL
jgi:hypothetical protein